MTGISPGTRQLLLFRQPALQFLIIVRIHRVQVCVTRQPGTIDAHGQTLQVTQAFQPDGLGFADLRHAVRQTHMKQRIGLHRPQVLTLLDNDARFRQVAIARTQRVQLGQGVGRPQGQVAQRAAVAHTFIVVCHPLPRVQLHAHHAEQVMAEGFAVLASDDKGDVGLRLHAGQLLRVLQGTAPIGLAACLAVIGQLAVLPIYFRQHGGIDGLQRRAGGLLLLLFQPQYCGVQRVRCHLGLQASAQQRCLQQLTEGAFFLCLVLYLLQMLHSGFGQVLLPGFLHLLPQLLICLTKDTHRRQQQCRCQYD